MKTTARSFSSALGRNSRLVRSTSSRSSSRRTYSTKRRAMDTDTGSGKQAADTMSTMDDELAMQLQRLRIAERENAELKRQIDELESELDIDFEALSLSEDEALLQEASLDMFESESSSGPTLPKLDSTPMVAYDNLKEEEEDLEQTKEVASASAAEEAEDLIPVDEVQEHASPAVEDALVEDQDRDTASTGDEDVAIVEEEEEELVLEEGEGSSGFLLTSLPKAGKLWSLVPKATLRVGKAGITEQVLQQLRDQLHESEEGLVKVQLFNKQLEPLDVANEIMQRMVDEDVIVAESKGRTLLFTMA